ncbi:MAG: ATP-binding protein [Ferruginibacter sp.]
MQHLYKHIPCVYFSASADGNIADVNEVLCKYLDYQRDELVGQKLENIFTLSTRIFQQTHFYPLLQLKGHAEEIYITLKAKDGAHVPMLINAERIDEDGEISFYFAGICVSKRKKFEDEIIAAKKAAEKALNENEALKAAKKELEQHAEQLDLQIALFNQQNKELRQFNHLATHTLQEPVRKLLFYSSQVVETPQDAKNVVAAQKFKKAIEDIQNKLQGLQQYVWLSNEALKYEPIDLSDIMQSAKKLVEQQNPGISIVLDAEAIPMIEANAEQMKFLMEELFTNATKFRKPGHVVNIKVFASSLQLNKFRQLPGKYKFVDFLKLQIQDEGIGFEDPYQDQAFELFRVLHPSGGLGIGLPLCKKIVENHNGSISLEGQIGVNSTVIIYLPLEPDKELQIYADMK